MALSDKLWETLTTVIKMNDRIVSMSAQMQAQQQRIEDLTARVIRLETALEIALGSRSVGRIEGSSAGWASTLGQWFESPAGMSRANPRNPRRMLGFEPRLS